MNLTEICQKIPHLREIVEAAFGKPLPRWINFSLKPIDHDCLISIPVDFEWEGCPNQKSTAQISFILPDRVLFNAVKVGKLIGSKNCDRVYRKQQCEAETVLDAINRLGIDLSPIGFYR